MKIKKIEETISHLISFITVEATKNKYGLVMTRYFYPKTKSWGKKIADFDDYGDIVTFVAWAGKLLQKQRWTLFAKDQLTKWLKYGKNRYGFYNTIDCDKSLKKNNLLQLASIYDLQDAVLGVYEMWKLTGDSLYQEELVAQFTVLKQVLNRNRGWLPNTVVIPGMVALPHVSANSAVTGLIAEHAFLYAKDSGDDSYIQFGVCLLKPWLHSKLWKKYSLFHQGYNTYLPNMSVYRQTKFMKENSNMVYAMLAYQKKYQHDIAKIITKLNKSRLSSGYYGCWYDAKTGQSNLAKGSDKTQNFTVIDVYVSLYQSTGNKMFLSRASNLAYKWREKEDSKTGLIPDYLDQNGNMKYHIAKLDQTADLYSSFLRVYLENGDKTLLNAAHKGGERMRKYFGNTDWWHRIVDTKTGRVAKNTNIPVSDQPTEVNITKYLGGTLRFYCMLYAVSQAKNRKDIQIMTRDR